MMCPPQPLQHAPRMGASRRCEASSRAIETTNRPQRPTRLRGIEDGLRRRPRARLVFDARAPETSTPKLLEKETKER